MNAQTSKLTLAALAFALCASGCSVYRVEVRQGNYIEQAKLAQVKAGMTHDQVRFLLGPPLIDDPFHRDRWDYVFTLESDALKGATIRRHILVLFEGDSVHEVQHLD